MLNSTLIKAALIKIVPSLSGIPLLITPAVVCSAFTLAGKCIMYKRECDQRKFDLEMKREKTSAEILKIVTTLAMAEKEKAELLSILRSRSSAY